MKRFGVILIIFLCLSLIGNGWLFFKIHKSSQVLQMQSASYNSFKSSLSDAVKATDAAKLDEPGSDALKSDAARANISLERSIGIIWGLRTDFAKKGMDVYPIFIALNQSLNFNPYESNFNSRETRNLINQNSKRLHDLESALGSTSFTNSGLKKLKNAVTSLYGKYDGYPSYTKLQ